MVEEKKMPADVDEKVKETLAEMHEHGMGCGLKIAEVAKLLHPDALLIIPLYRSCLVVEQSGEDKKDGDCTIHSYADPHWLGGEIDLKHLKIDRFHKVYKVQGDRQGFSIIKIIQGIKGEVLR